MKNNFVIFSITIFIVIFSCKEKTDSSGNVLLDVRIGIHANEGGSPLAAVAKEQGFFAKYQINPIFTIVESGPAEMTAMRADNRTLDIGYIGAGVAWNPIDGNGNQLSFIFLDCLSNAEMLIAKKGIFTDSNNNNNFDNEEIFQGLKQRTVYIEVGTTSGSWFQSLVDLLNAGKVDAQKLWLSSETASYLAGYNPPNSKEANKIIVINTLNSNLPAGMASNRVGMALVVGFSPATTTILKTNPDVVTVATTAANFPPEKSFPSTWVASASWLENNPQVAQNLVNVLYEAAIWRANNMEVAMRLGEKLAQKPANSFHSFNLVVPTKAHYQAWFQGDSALGYAYMKALYDSKVAYVPAGNIVKSFQTSFEDKYLLAAIATTP